ncbi:MAG: CHASE3 domain-containing protein [Sphingomonadales bacterium]|nr:CHASE3 domain-containing protein [Sphingomonadales bacterium]
MATQPVTSPGTAPRLWRALVLAAMVSAILWGISLSLSAQFEGFSERQRNVRRVYEQEAVIARLVSDLRKAEAAQRSYVLTGDAGFLQPYEQLRATAAARVAQLRGLYANEARPVREHIALVAGLVPQKLDEMQRIQDLHAREGRDAAAARIAQGIDGRLMERIGQASGAVKAQQDAFLAAQLTSGAREAVERRRLYTIALLLVTAAAFAVAYVIWHSGRARHKALVEAIDAGARQMAIFNSALNAIVLINPSGSIEVMNPAAERLFGYPATDLLRRDISIIADLGPGEGPFLDRIGLTDDGLAQPFRPLVRARRSDGGIVPVEVALGLMALEDGMHVVAVFRDVSEREKVEQIKDQFLSTVSHELRTPLTSIVGSLGLLRAGVADALTDQQQRLVDIAENNAHRLIRIVNDILDAEKLQSGQMTFAMTPVDLCDVVTSAVASMSGLAATRNIALLVAAPDEPVMVEGDKDRLVQVVNNLLSNAIKFAPSGSRVDVRVMRDGRHGRIAVIDRGPGIPVDLRDRLFTRFAQGAISGRAGTPGTGLGLTISREIVQHHRGTLTFADAPGGGTVFTIELPLESGPAEQGKPDGTPRLLLYADATEAETLAASFAARSIRADPAASIADAASAAGQRRYLAMIVDFQFAGEDAPALIHAVRAEPHGRALPIIGIVGDGQAADPDRTAAIDIIDWLRKPIDPQQLDAAIAAAMARARVDMPLVLHVDDDPDTLEVTAAALAGHARVAQARDLGSARAFLADTRADILIVDIGLPDGSGLELVSDLAGTERAGTPVIIYTAQDMGGDLREVEAVLTKSRKTLPNLVETILAIARRQEGRKDE